MKPMHDVARVKWRALDREGEDTCRLAQVDGGWVLLGHARFRDADGLAALDYVVRCAPDWQTLGADIAGKHGDRSISIKIERNDETWTRNGTVQDAVAGAIDIDLGFTPATNLMPLRRLFARGVPKLETRSAWLRYPECDLKPLDQIYDAGNSEELVSYNARQTGFSTQLCVHHSGFVTLYPGYWQGEVTHEKT